MILRFKSRPHTLKQRFKANFSKKRPVYKLCEPAKERWRKLKGYELIEKVLKGTFFKDSEEVEKAT